jgi:hypothetical protein
MSPNERLWPRILAAFEAHRKPGVDVNAHAALERVATKCLGSSEPIRLNPSTCSAHEESFSLAALRELVVFHPRKSPQRLRGPIVVLAHLNRRVVIDGNNRVNLWLAEHAPGPFEAIVIVPNHAAA